MQILLGQAVAKQELLQLLPECKMLLSDNGQVMLRFRINDVSKNHQKQLFSILISPDTTVEPLMYDISPDISESIEVRSKKTKRAKVEPGASILSSTD